MSRKPPNWRRIPMHDTCADCKYCYKPTDVLGLACKKYNVRTGGLHVCDAFERIDDEPDKERRDD